MFVSGRPVEAVREVVIDTSNKSVKVGRVAPPTGRISQTICSEIKNPFCIYKHNCIHTITSPKVPWVLSTSMSIEDDPPTGISSGISTFRDVASNS